MFICFLIFFENIHRLVFEHVHFLRQGDCPMYSATYYICYLAICTLLILWLSHLLNRSGAIFLSEAFNGSPVLVTSVTRLLDVGFYLTSFGYQPVVQGA